MLVSKIMTRKIVTVEMDDPLSLIKEIFERVPFHHLLVIDNGKLYGVISDRDLFKSLSPQLGTVSETKKDLFCLNKKAHQIMSRKPISLYDNDDIYQAIDIFIEKSISCIPIVDHTNKPIGVISWRDILRAVADKRPKNNT